MASKRVSPIQAYLGRATNIEGLVSKRFVPNPLSPLCDVVKHQPTP